MKAFHTPVRCFFKYLIKLGLILQAHTSSVILKRQSLGAVPFIIVSTIEFGFELVFFVGWDYPASEVVMKTRPSCPELYPDVNAELWVQSEYETLLHVISPL